jgi:hypothetical protein
MTEDTSTDIEITPRTRTPEAQLGTSSTVEPRFLAQWLEIQEDTTAIKAEIAQYRDAPSSDFVDLEDVDD